MSGDLFQAIASGDREAVEAALAGDPGVARARDDNGVSAVLWALYHRQRPIAERLARDRTDLDIFEAAALGRTENLERHLEADSGAIGAVGPDGFTPLHLAAYFDRGEVARRLLERGADANATAGNESRVRPLHSAVAGRSAGIARLLLAAGADADARQQGGWTALMAAARHGEVDLVRDLLEHGADPRMKSDDGQQALDLTTDGEAKAMLETAGREWGGR